MWREPSYNSALGYKTFFHKHWPKLPYILEKTGWIYRFQLDSSFSSAFYRGKTLSPEHPQRKVRGLERTLVTDGIWEALWCSTWKLDVRTRAAELKYLVMKLTTCVWTKSLIYSLMGETELPSRRANGKWKQKGESVSGGHVSAWLW